MWGNVWYVVRIASLAESWYIDYIAFIHIHSRHGQLWLWWSDWNFLVSQHLLFLADFYQLMIPEYPKCYLNASETIRMSIFTTCGPNYIEFCHLTCGSHSCHLGFKGKGKVYLSTRSSHHPKTVDSFQLTRLALSEDVCPNPGPGTSARNINKLKCNTSKRTVARMHRVVRCQSCQFLYDVKCASLTLKDYHRYESGMNRS